MSERVLLQPGFILHRRPYRNSSLIVEFFTQNYGRIAGVIKGARRPKSPYLGLTQVFFPVLVSWLGKGDLVTITALEGTGRAMLVHPQAIYVGFYLNELILRLLQNQDPHAGLYSNYEGILTQLTGSRQDEWHLRIFEKKLLQALGFGLILDREVTQQVALQADQKYHYVMELGPVLAQEERSSQNEGVLVLGECLLCLNHELAMNRQVLHQAKLLMRTVLDYYLGHKPLKTRLIYQQMCLKDSAP